MSDRLVPARLRATALAIVSGCVVVIVVLGVHYSDTNAPGRLDRNLDLRIRARLADHHGLLEHLARLGDPATVIAWSLLLAVVCMLAGRYRGAVFCLVGPPLAGGIADYVLKPVIDRQIGFGLAFPSGHTTGAFAVAVCAVVLLLVERTSISVGVRVAVGVLALALAAGVAAAVIGLGYHYTTDTVGGLCVAVAVVLGLAVVIDIIGDRSLSPRAP